MSPVAAAEDEAAIHHRPTVSSEAVTDKANRINKALAEALLLCTQTSLWPLCLLFLLKFHLFFSSLLTILVRFSLHLCLFQGDIIYLCLATTSVNIISICPSAQPQVNMLIHSGAVSLDRR